MNDFLTIVEQDPATIATLVSQGLAIKADPSATAGELTGTGVGLFFMKPSTRTRVSAEIGSVQLGAHPVVLKNEEVGLGGRESVEDVARTLDRYLDALAFRVFEHGHLVAVAEHAEAPVINLLSDIEHPCQAIADLMTIREHTDPDGATLAYVGDGNNVCHSLMVGAAMMGMNVRVATPAGFEPSADYVAAASRYSSTHITNDPAEAVAGADVVYTDVWASMGQEQERTDFMRSPDSPSTKRCLRRQPKMRCFSIVFPLIVAKNSRRVSPSTSAPGSSIRPRTDFTRSRRFCSIRWRDHRADGTTRGVVPAGGAAAPRHDLRHRHRGADHLGAPHRGGSLRRRR